MSLHLAYNYIQHVCDLGHFPPHMAELFDSGTYILGFHLEVFVRTQ